MLRASFSFLYNQNGCPQISPTLTKIIIFKMVHWPSLGSPLWSASILKLQWLLTWFCELCVRKAASETHGYWSRSSWYHESCFINMEMSPVLLITFLYLLTMQFCSFPSPTLSGTYADYSVVIVVGGPWSCYFISLQFVNGNNIPWTVTTISSIASFYSYGPFMVPTCNRSFCSMMLFQVKTLHGCNVILACTHTLFQLFCFSA